MGCNGADGGCNIALGPHAGQCGTTGDKNIFLGFNTGKNSTTGCYNIFFGTEAGLCNTTANCNVAAGIFAARCRNSYSGIFIGESAGMGCNGATGAGNIMLGQKQENVAQLVLIMLFLVIVQYVSPQADITLYLVKVQEKL